MIDIYVWAVTLFAFYMIYLVYDQSIIIKKMINSKQKSDEMIIRNSLVIGYKNGVDDVIAQHLIKNTSDAQIRLIEMQYQVNETLPKV